MYDAFFEYPCVFKGYGKPEPAEWLADDSGEYLSAKEAYGSYRKWTDYRDCLEVTGNSDEIFTLLKSCGYRFHAKLGISAVEC
jgi:hypothetical protein